MPTYCYRCDFCNRTQDKFQTVAGRNRRVSCECGKRMIRDYAAEMGYIKVPLPGNWPMKSDAMGVNPDQIAEVEAHSRRVGVPTCFDRETGQAILTSPLHRKRYAKAIGLFDRDAGYSDPTPT